MLNRFPIDKASSEPTRRACLKGAAGFALAALGGLNQVAQAATATTPGTTVSGETVAALPAGELGTVFAYVGCRTTKERNARGEGINVYRVDPATGAWTHVQLLKDLVNPSFLAFDAKQRFLYSVHGDSGEVSAFGIDGATGEISFLNQQSTGGKNPVHLTVDPTNRYLLVANYATGSLATLPIGSDGKLDDMTSLAELPGTPGPHKVEQASSHPHNIPYDADRGFLVVPDNGLDRVFVFKLDPNDGKLVPNDPPSVVTRSGSGPRHVVFHPTAGYAYVVNELDSTVTAYAYDRAKGVLEPRQILTTLPAAFTGENRAAGIGITPTGRFLYASNRGHNQIAIFAIDQATGLLTPAGWESTQGKMPRFFTLDLSGEFLYAANEATDTIVGFRVDGTSGKLTPIGTVVQTGSPVCIVFRTISKA
jgi:6-phosphogluconolactonase